MVDAPIKVMEPPRATAGKDEYILLGHTSNQEEAALVGHSTQRGTASVDPIIGTALVNPGAYVQLRGSHISGPLNYTLDPHQ
jgi:hypothetical protein